MALDAAQARLIGKIMRDTTAIADLISEKGRQDTRVTSGGEMPSQVGNGMTSDKNTPLAQMDSLPC